MSGFIYFLRTILRWNILLIISGLEHFITNIIFEAVDVKIKVLYKLI